MFDMTTTARLALALAQTATETLRGVPAPRPPAPARLDTRAVIMGCPFCDDIGCRDCVPRARRFSLGTMAPENDDDDTITEV